jgi:nucleolar GTP-binding protein
MYKIPTVLTAAELMDKAYHKASKITERTKFKDQVKRRRIQVQSKIDAVADIIDTTLGKYISTFPSFDQVHKFEYELVDLIIGVDRLRKSLGAIDWCRKQVLKLRKNVNRQVQVVTNMRNFSKLEQYRSHFYGRVSSLINQIAKDLDLLNSARDKLKKLPAIDPEKPTVVVAGYPNVGKSLVVERISSAKPMIASYPFTTQQLNIGHLKIEHDIYQIIDTPGILDRPFEKRNKIERQAIMALRYLANLIIFILDPSEHCGYTNEEQNRLLNELQELFSDIDITIVENKLDIHRSSSDNLKISAKENQGISELIDLIEGSM